MSDNATAIGVPQTMPSDGDPAFETWFGSYSPAGKSDKQGARDAYAAVTAWLRNVVLEEAAQACDQQEMRANLTYTQAACRLCANSIRALKEKNHVHV